MPLISVVPIWITWFLECEEKSYYYFYIFCYHSLEPSLACVNGNYNKRKDVDMVVHSPQDNTINKGNEGGSRIPKEVSNERWIRAFMCGSSEKYNIHLVKVIGKSIWSIKKDFSYFLLHKNAISYS